MPGPFSIKCKSPSQTGRRRNLIGACLGAVALTLVSARIPQARQIPIEKEVLAYVRGRDFQARDGQCRDQTRYTVYLIDNFEQTFSLLPELVTSHGELLARLLKSGRDDIDAIHLNTTLTRGLAMVLRHLAKGGCVDAVISSIPGSNYTYNQVKTLLPRIKDLNPDTRIGHRNALKRRLKEIAFKGYPSVKWMRQADVNLTKLKEDAVKLVFIQALGKFGIRVILPYGNSDAPHRGHPKMFNLLSLADNALVYTGLTRSGQRVGGFPYSPLSSGDETAVYTLKECLNPDQPGQALLDINEDGFFDYAFALPRKKAADRSRDEKGCRIRGFVRGTSVIPPLKVKELLPPK